MVWGLVCSYAQQEWVPKQPGESKSPASMSLGAIENYFYRKIIVAKALTNT